MEWYGGAMEEHISRSPSPGVFYSFHITTDCQILLYIDYSAGVFDLIWADAAAGFHSRKNAGTLDSWLETKTNVTQ